MTTATETTTIHTGETVAEFGERLERIGDAIWELDHRSGRLPRIAYRRAVMAFRRGDYEASTSWASTAYHSYLRRTG